MATVTKPIALDESINTTENPSRNIADVLAEELAGIAGAITTAENVENILTDMATTKTAPTISGTAVFETIDGNLVKALKVAVTPSQDLHGYDHPWVGGAGKNKLPMTVSGIKSVNTDGTWTGNSYVFNDVTWTILTDDGENVIGIDGHGTASSQSNFFLLKGNYTFPAGSYKANGVTGGGASTYLIYVNTPATEILNGDYTITFDGLQSPNILCVARGGVNLNHTKFYPMIRLSTVTDSTFEPYTNICPISGHTQDVISVKDSTDTTQATYTIPFGQTVYGGTLDVLTGELTIDSAMAILTGDNVQSISAGSIVDADGGKRININITGVKYVQGTATAIADRLAWNNSIYLGGTNSISVADDGRLVIRFAGASTVEDAQTALNNTNIQVCYELATPTTISLTPQKVKALVGENHISASTGDVLECKYSMMINGDDLAQILGG